MRRPEFMAMLAPNQRRPGVRRDDEWDYFA